MGYGQLSEVRSRRVLHKRAIERLSGTWAGSGKSGFEFSVAGHLYERDLPSRGGNPEFALGPTRLTLSGWPASKSRLRL
jgi:hypothetical protein